MTLLWRHNLLNSLNSITDINQLSKPSAVNPQSGTNCELEW